MRSPENKHRIENNADPKGDTVKSKLIRMSRRLWFYLIASLTRLWLKIKPRLHFLTDCWQQVLALLLPPPRLSSNDNDHSENNPGADVDIDESKPIRLSWWLMLVGFGGFVLWGALAPLDKGLQTDGVVVIAGSHKLVQSRGSGIVQAIHIKEGAQVEPEQLLVELDSTHEQAQLSAATAQLYVLQAVEARLIAERDGSPEINFPQELLSAAEDSRVAEAIALQRSLIQTRRAAVQSDISVMRESVVGLKAQLQTQEEILRARKEQVRLLQEELTGLRELAKEGFLARNRLSEQERQLSQQLEVLSQDIGSIARTRSSITETNLRISAKQTDRQREIETLLADTEKEVNSLQSRIKSLEFDLANTKIKAPSEGIVVELKVHTIGGTVSPGMTLMDIVPKNAALKISIQVLPNLIDRVKPGYPVQVRFTALNQITTPMVTGTVLSVAPDVVVKETTKESVYKAIVEVTPEGMLMLRDKEILPGMPASVFVKTGERTMLQYLLTPLTIRLQQGFTEQ